MWTDANNLHLISCSTDIQIEHLVLSDIKQLLCLTGLQAACSDVLVPQLTARPSCMFDEEVAEIQALHSALETIDSMIAAHEHGVHGVGESSCIDAAEASPGIFWNLWAVLFLSACAVNRDAQDIFFHPMCCTTYHYTTYHYIFLSQFEQSFELWKVLRLRGIVHCEVQEGPSLEKHCQRRLFCIQLFH